MNNDNIHILIADDDGMNRAMLKQRLLSAGYQVTDVCDGCEVLPCLHQHPFDLVLLDIDMPNMSGLEALQCIKNEATLQHLPVVMVTANEDIETNVKCIELGADDYIAKPYNPIILHARVKTCLHKKRYHDERERLNQTLEDQNGYLESRVRAQLKELTAAQLASIFAMSKLAESKDPETGAHLDRLREYCRVLAIELRNTPQYSHLIDETFVESIYAASPLHDVGKVGVPDSILLKPGKLDKEEWEIMQTHSTIGADTLRAVLKEHPKNAFVRMGIEVAQYHHEKWDGSGYPEGLSGDAIPLSARILALGDVYDALTSKRCYKEAFSHEKSKQIILEGKGLHFDPCVVEAFMHIENQFKAIRQRYQDPDE